MTRQQQEKGATGKLLVMLTCDFEKLCAHFNDLDAGRNLLRLLLDDAGTFCDGIGNGCSPVRTKANESAKLNRVDGAAVIVIEGQEQILDVFGQAVLGRHCLQLEDKERLGRHGFSRLLSLKTVVS
jgi:hypothetical protein